MRSFLVLACLAMFSGGIAQSAHAVTRYVEGSWGSDSGSNDCRDKKAPCATIGYAIGQAGTRDRVLVGPGVYTPTSPIYLTVPGISLVSVAGSAATIIDGTAITAEAVIGIGYNEKAVLGQKRKGFTVIADGSVSDAIVFVAFSRTVRIEGNRLIGLSDVTTSGIALAQNDAVTIRYNDIHSAHSNPMEYGIRTADHGFGDEYNRKWNLSDNRIRHVDRCIRLFSTAANHGNKVSKNRLENCAEYGVLVYNYDSTGAPGQSSRDRYQDNVVLMKATSTAYGMLFRGGNPRVQRNLVDAREGFTHGVWLRATRNANIRDNVLLGPPPSGGAFSNVNGLSTDTAGPGSSTHNTGMVIQGNSIDRFNHVVAADLREVKTLKNNNLLQANTCPIYTPNVMPPSTLKASRNFWGDPAGPDLSSCSSTALAETNGYIEFKPAPRANPVRFKDPFH